MIDEKKWGDGIQQLNEDITYEIQRSKRLTLPDKFKSWDNWLDFIEENLLALPPEVLKGFNMTLLRINCARHRLKTEDMDGALLFIFRVEADYKNAQDDLNTYELNQKIIKAKNLSIANSDKGAIGAARRWGEREDVDRIINQLASKQDALGGLSSIAELWPEFYSKLDDAQLNPNEKIDVMTWENNPHGMTLKTFKNRISASRKEAKKQSRNPDG